MIESNIFSSEHPLSCVIVWMSIHFLRFSLMRITKDSVTVFVDYLFLCPSVLIIVLNLKCRLIFFTLLKWWWSSSFRLSIYKLPWVSKDLVNKISLRLFSVLPLYWIVLSQSLVTANESQERGWYFISSYYDY